MSIKDALDIFKKGVLSEDKYNLILDTLISRANNFYIFNDILKNHPNPNYFPNINLEEELTKIKSQITVNLTRYEFYCMISKVFVKARDRNFNIYNTEYKGIIYPPIQLDIFYDKTKNEKYFKVDINQKVLRIEDGFRNFTNFNKINETVNKNKNIKVKTINGRDPFEYIENFQSEYNYFKNEHGRFTWANEQFNSGDMNNALFESETDFNNIKIIYENEDSFTFDFMFFKLSKEESKSLTNTSFWDHSTENKIYCKVDRNNEINVILHNSYQWDYKDNFFKFLGDCYKEFNSNDYPIILINDVNQGGGGSTSFLFQQIFQPKYIPKIYMGVKHNNYTSDILRENYFNQMINPFYNPESCEQIEEKEVDQYINKRRITIDLGNGIKHTTIKPIIMDFNYTKEIESIKDKAGIKPRKNTELLIFTDGMSFGSTSFMLKAMKEFGGAILVGYKGDPRKSKDTFDAGNGLSLVASLNDGLTPLSEHSFYIDHAWIETFDHKFTNDDYLKTPREYQQTLIDERVDIYSKYKDSDYQLFIDEAKRILNKYNNGECNPKNKKLTYETTKCDQKILDTVTHGGYLCGDDGKWTKKCSPFYCDEGYFFDYSDNSCHSNFNCERVPEKERGYFDIHRNVLVAIIIIGFILLSFISFIIYCIAGLHKDETLDSAKFEQIFKGPILT